MQEMAPTLRRRRINNMAIPPKYTSCSRAAVKPSGYRGALKEAMSELEVEGSADIPADPKWLLYEAYKIAKELQINITTRELGRKDAYTIFRVS
jgi:hypothetical protein